MDPSVTSLYAEFKMREMDGKPTPPDELCRERACPHLEAELRRVVAELDQKDEALRPAPAAADAPPACLLNRYCVGPRLGQGGFGSVHRGYDTRMKRPVAIKFL